MMSENPLPHLLVVPLTARMPTKTARPKPQGAEQDFAPLPVCLRAALEDIQPEQQILLDLFGRELVLEMPKSTFGYAMDDLIVIAPPKANYRFWTINWGKTNFTARSLPEVIGFYYARKQLKASDWACLNDLVAREVTDVMYSEKSNRVIVRLHGCRNRIPAIGLKLAAPRAEMLAMMIDQYRLLNL